MNKKYFDFDSQEDVDNIIDSIEENLNSKEDSLDIINFLVNHLNKEEPSFFFEDNNIIYSLSDKIHSKSLLITH